MRCNLIYIFIAVPPNPKKIEALRSCGALNRNPQKVRHPLFTEHDFFDPHDMVQLKYETIRAVDVDGRPIAEASADFGLSRPLFTRRRRTSDRRDLGGFCPKSVVRKKHANSRRKFASIWRSLLSQSPILKPLRLPQESEDASALLSIPAP